jgi:predicted DNA-binding antitoxin AbrB/MazE fold protein
MLGVSGYNGDEPALNCLIRRNIMMTVIEVVFENGLFRPLVEADFKMNHRYKLIIEEASIESKTRINGGADDES